VDLVEFVAEFFSGHLEEVLEYVASEVVTVCACFDAFLNCTSSDFAVWAPFIELSGSGLAAVTIDLLRGDRVARP